MSDIGWYYSKIGHGCDCEIANRDRPSQLYDATFFILKKLNSHSKFLRKIFNSNFFLYNLTKIKHRKKFLKMKSIMMKKSKNLKLKKNKKSKLRKTLKKKLKNKLKNFR